MSLRMTLWTVENLVFWDEALHGNVIESPNITHPCSTKMHLYPKGLNSKDDVMKLHVFPGNSANTNGSGIWGSLLVRDSYGKVVMNENINLRSNQQFCEFKIFRFSEMVIGSWEEDTAEQENLRFECSINTRQPFDETYCMRTRVEVFDVRMKIPNKIITECEFVYPVRAFEMEYPRDERSSDVMAVFLSTDRKSNVQIELKPDSFKKCFWAYVYLTVVIQKRVQKEQGGYLFRDGNKWIYNSSFVKQQLQRAGVELTVRVKIVPSGRYQHDSHFSGMCNRAATLQVFPTACYNTSHFTESINPISLNQPGNSVDALTKDFSRLCREGHYSDLRLRCGDVTFPVHKAILSSRSPVFKAWFSDPAIERTVEIVNLDASTLGLLLSHLYTGVGGELNWESALKLYRAAEKYQVPSLKARCSSLLGASVCFDNVVEILSLVATYRDESLFTVAIKFFLKNKEKIVCSKKWDIFMISNPRQVLKLLKLSPRTPTCLLNYDLYLDC